MESIELTPQFQLREIYYKCTECASPIEILSISEIYIEFKCINNNHNIKVAIKEYLKKMKNFNNMNINNDKCNVRNHNKFKYVCYCLDCNKHLCEECLKTREHIGHNKTNIIEIQPNKEELKLIEDLIKKYDNTIVELEKEKMNKKKDMDKKLEEFKNKLNERKKIKRKKIDEKKQKELKENKDKYELDMKIIRRKGENEIKLEKYKYKKIINEIDNKYKRINEYNNIIYKNKGKKFADKFIKIRKQNNSDKKIENKKNFKKLIEIIIKK